MKKICIFLLILLFPIKGFTQEDKFVVLTFSVKDSYDKIVWEYFWITPFDSISTESSIPIKLTPFAADDSFEACLVDEKWQYATDMGGFIWYFKKLESDATFSQRLIYDNRKLLQRIKKKWELNGCRLDIKVYATPIKGNIHVCRQKYLEIGHNKTYYLYYTEDRIEYWPGFWETDRAKEIMEIDYGYIEFDLNWDYDLLFRKAKQE